MLREILKAKCPTRMQAAEPMDLVMAEETSPKQYKLQGYLDDEVRMEQATRTGMKNE